MIIEEYYAATMAAWFRALARREEGDGSDVSIVVLSITVSLKPNFHLYSSIIYVFCIKQFVLLLFSNLPSSYLLYV
jgi:hypothetical protein